MKISPVQLFAFIVFTIYLQICFTKNKYLEIETE